jgi:DNA topoisomerase-1
MHDGDFRSLKKEDDLYTVELARALELLNEPRGSRGAKVIKDFGKVEALGKKVKVHDGKYGVYIKAGTKNIAVPEEFKSPEKAENLTEAQVVDIVKKAQKK